MYGLKIQLIKRKSPEFRNVCMKVTVSWKETCVRSLETLVIKRMRIRLLGIKIVFEHFMSL